MYVDWDITEALVKKLKKSTDKWWNLWKLKWNSDEKMSEFNENNNYAMIEPQVRNLWNSVEKL